MSPGLETAYQQYRQGRSGTLILIHGFLDKAATWQPIVDQFDLPDWTIAGLELEQLSLDATLDNVLDQFASAAAEAVNHIRSSNSAPLVIAGHSMGGQIAELVAAKIGDVDGLILIVPAPLSGYPLTEDQQAAFTASAKQKDRDAIGKGRGSRAMNPSPEVLRLLVETAATTTVDFSLKSLKAWTEGHVSGSAPSRVSAPTLLITTDDKFLTRDFLERKVLPRFSKGATVTIAGAGHWPHVEQPTAVVKTIREFLSTLAQKRPSRTDDDVKSELMTWFFHDYFWKWVEIGNGSAPLSDMLNFWGSPLHAAAMVQTNWLMTPDDVLKQIERTQEPLKGRQYSHTVVLDHRITVFNSSAAAIDGIWSRRQKDETEIQRVASHFEIHMTDKGWRVVAMANRLTAEASLNAVWPTTVPALPNR